MADGPLTTVLHRLRRLTAPNDRPAGDAELLERFVQRRDADAFELLVWRHAGLVWGV